MAKNFSKKLYGSKQWRDIRNFVLHRDFYMCKICGEINCNTVHHIIELTPVNVNDASVTLNPDNLITICNQCHDEVHDRNYRQEQNRYTFDADGNIIPTADCNKRERQDRYTDEQRAHIKRLQVRLKG